MRITCSNCGMSVCFRTTTGNVRKYIKAGWGSFGSALYCPECTKTWYERNTHELASEKNTMNVIVEIHEHNRERRKAKIVNNGDLTNQDYYDKYNKALNEIEQLREENEKLKQALEYSD